MARLGTWNMKLSNRHVASHDTVGLKCCGFTHLQLKVARSCKYYSRCCSPREPENDMAHATTGHGWFQSSSVQTLADLFANFISLPGEGYSPWSWEAPLNPWLRLLFGRDLGGDFSHGHRRTTGARAGLQRLRRSCALAPHRFPLLKP